MGVAEVAASEHGGFDPDKVTDQLRVAFQASQVKRKRTRFTDKDKPRPKRRKGQKRRRAGDGVFTTTSEDEEELRDDSVFHQTLVPFDNTMADNTDDDESEEEKEQD